MSEKEPRAAEPLRIVAVIATLPSRIERLHTAVRSVLAQDRLPDELIVVVDEEHGYDPAIHCNSLANLSTSSLPVRVLVNRRTKNMSGTGSWNTAIIEAINSDGSAQNDATFLAILDDDDEWNCDHLARCADKVNFGVDWVISWLERRTVLGNTGSAECATLEAVSESAFLRGNPGVQGSNIFMRLPLILRAGCFDESMRSATDRDLCIRALEVLGAGTIAFTNVVTVLHHAEPRDVRERVTTDPSAKLQGLRAFIWKHQHRYSVEDWALMRARQKAFYGIDVDDIITTESRSDIDVVYPTPPPAAMAATLSGDVVSLQPSTLAYLAQNSAVLTVPGGLLQPLQRGMFGIVSSDITRLRPLLRDLTELGPSAEILVFANTRNADEIKEAVHATGRGLMICLDDPAATSVAASMYRALGAEVPSTDRYEIAVARTILQTHMRELLLSPERHAVDFAVVLDDDKRIPAGSLLRSSDGLARLAREGEHIPSVYVGRDCKTAPNTLAFGLRVQLLDLLFTLKCRAGICARVQNPRSVIEDGHDSYYDLSSARFNHLEAPELAPSVQNAHARILRGDPLARDVLPPLCSSETTQRGGCLLLFRRNFDILARPQYVPEIILPGGGKILSRRSDSLWVRSLCGGVRCQVHPGLFVFHENIHDGILSPSAIRRNALAETFGAILCRGEGERQAYMCERLRMMVANNERIRGLLYLLTEVARDVGAGREQAELVSLHEHLVEAFDGEAWEREVFEPLRRNYGRAVIGFGAEGVVTRDEFGICTKVFLGSAPTTSLDLLESRGVLGCHIFGPGVLQYPYVDGDPYRGGHYEAMIECMRRIKAAGLVMNNIKPANLVLGRSGEIVVVDLGRDWVPYSPKGFMSMCHRGFLSERLGPEDDPRRLCELMRACSSLADPASHVPELTGFHTFFERCNIDPALERVQEAVAPTATMIIKTCLMESATILANVRHIVHTLRDAGNHFHETVLAVDRSKRDGFLRQYAHGDVCAFDAAITAIRAEGLVDRVHNFDAVDDERLSALNRKYFALEEETGDVSLAHATHSATGVPHAALFSALETVTTDLSLQLDSDIRLNMHGGHEHVAARAAEAFSQDGRIVTVLALPIFFLSPPMDQTDFRYHTSGLAHRFEIRCSFLHMPRFREMLPLRGAVGPTGLRNWYRVFDDNVASQGRLSMRFVSPGGFFLHPPNSIKVNTADYMLVADRVAAPPRPSTPSWRRQHGNVDIVSDWEFGERAERCIFVLYGCGVPHSTAIRCLRSLGVSGQPDFGVIVVDDAPPMGKVAEWPAPLFEEAYRLHPDHVTCIHTGVHLGPRCSLDHAIRRVCIDRHSVIVPLGLDQYLYSGDTLSTLRNTFCDAESFFDRLVGVGTLFCFRRAVFLAIDRDTGDVGATFRVDGDASGFPVDEDMVAQLVTLAGDDRVFRFTDSLVQGYPRGCVTRQADLTTATPCRLPTLGPELVAPPCCLSTPVDRLWTFAPNPISLARCVVRVVGEVRGKRNVPVRIHSECLTGDGFRSARCDCGEQRNVFLDLMEDNGTQCAVLVHIAGHEGRGHGLDIKVREYELNDRNPAANHNDILTRELGVNSLDPRDYGDAARILHDVLEIESVVLFSNNPRKRAALVHRFGAARLVSRTMTATTTLHNERYLRDKIRSLDHDPRLVGSLLSPDDANHLLARLGVVCDVSRLESDGSCAANRQPGMDLLLRTIRAFLERLPFENLALVIGAAAASPKLEECSTSATHATGLCFDRNVLLAELLRHHLGFRNVDVVGARTKGNADSLIHDHIVVVVTLGPQEEYLVDVGNGTPYFSPLRLPADEASHSILHYRVRTSDDDLFVVEHDRHEERHEWRENYLFQRGDILDARKVYEIVHRHRTDAGFGPMLTHVRMNRWGEHNAVIIRDVEGRVIQDSRTLTRTTFSSGDELQDFVLRHFGGETLRKLDHAVAPLIQNINACLSAAPPPLLNVLATWPSLPVVVTGCAGYIGSHLTRRLLALGTRVLGVDSMSTLLGEASAKQARIAEFGGSERFSFYSDIDDLPTAHVLGPIVVFHLAGQPNVRECERHPDVCRRDNSDLTERLLSRIHPESHVVFAGSSTVYGDAPTPWSEDTALQPKGAYAMSKQACEEHLRKFADLGGQATVLRLFSVTGEHCRPDLAAAKFLGLISAGKTITIYGDGEQERDITYVGDVVEGMLSAGRRATFHRFRVYNFGRGVPTTLNTIIALIETELQRVAVREYLPALPMEARVTHAANDRARAELGFDPSIDAATAIKRMIRATNLSA